MRQAVDDGVDQAAIAGERIRTAHQPEHAIARVLQRQVEVRREAATASRRRDSTISGVQSIGSSELILNVTSAGDESSARRSDTSELDGVQVSPVRAQMNTGQRDFLEARGRHALDLTKDVVNRQAAAGAARRRNDAVAAALLAAGLHAEGERRAARDAGLDRRAACAVAVREPLGRRLDEPVLLVVADDANDVRKRGDLVAAGAWRSNRSQPRCADGLSRAMRLMVCRAP